MDVVGISIYFLNINQGRKGLMKRTIVSAYIMVVLLLASTTLYAANGDLIVNGSVGIGTTLPQLPLEISQKSLFPGLNILKYSTGRASIGLGLNNGTMSNTGMIVGRDLQNAGINDFFISDFASDAIRFYINSVGNVGIGTTWPGSKLSLYDANESTAVPVLRINTGTGGVGGSGGAIEFYKGYESHPMGRIYTANMYSAGVGDSKGRLILSSYYNSFPDELTLYNGKVGIGTANPNSKLEIMTEVLGTALNSVMEKQRWSGNCVANNDFLDIRTIRTSEGADWYSTGTRIQQKIDSTWMGYLQFNGNGNHGGISFGTGMTVTAPGNVNEAMRIVNNGNVGIGTTTPMQTISIAPVSAPVFNIGKVCADSTNYTGIAVANDGIADCGHYSMLSDGYNLFLNRSSGYAMYFREDNHDQMFIAPGGNVGIGTTNPTQKLDVAGNVASNGVVLTSDAKLKKNLEPIHEALSKVLSLNGLSYEWRKDEFKERNLPDGRHFGVIAQEIEKVLPQVVSTAPDGTKAVAYTEIIPVLIEAIKEQQEKIEKQQIEIGELKQLLSFLQSRLGKQ